MTPSAKKPPLEPRQLKSASQIRLMNGDIEDQGNTIIRVGLFGNREVWRRVRGSGAGALYELEGED